MKTVGGKKGKKEEEKEKAKITFTRKLLQIETDEH